ncbi:hypothetical protein ACFP4H_14760 [Pseudophaeobacter arcticus]|uniref:hypothetical protein n=1 Tax=Pseudophaeobacter arcticus TaxID=385492 RepID=UPI000483928C|nr:hypothetical protein [Pseudophaeobacter arcticus]
MKANIRTEPTIGDECGSLPRFEAPHLAIDSQTLLMSPHIPALEGSYEKPVRHRKKTKQNL